MKDFIKQLTYKFKSVYLVWILFNFILLMVGGGIFNTYNSGGFLRYDSDFFPFGNGYDYTEFLVYTIVPFLLYYAYWLWNKNKA